MKLLCSVFLLAFLCVGKARCQDTLLISKHYPFSVILKVQDVNSVINLSAERKVQFANFFQKEDAQMQAAILADSTAKQVSALKNTLSAEFVSLLTPAEFDLYSNKKKGAPYAKKTVPTGGSSPLINPAQ